MVVLVKSEVRKVYLNLMVVAKSQNRQCENVALFAVSYFFMCSRCLVAFVLNGKNMLTCNCNKCNKTKELLQQ